MNGLSYLDWYLRELSPRQGSRIRQDVRNALLSEGKFDWRNFLGEDRPFQDPAEIHSQLIQEQK